MHGGASGEGGEGGLPEKEIEDYGSMVIMRTSRPHFIQGVLGGRSGRGPLAGLIGPTVTAVKNAGVGKVGAHSVTPNLWGKTTLQSTIKSKGTFFFLVNRRVT